MPVGSSDPRFAGVATDPRFRRPKQNKVKVELDERFRKVLESDEFGGLGAAAGGKKGKRLDKYGRPLAKSHHQDQLKHFYKLKSPEAGEEAQEDAKTPKQAPSADFVDYARGDGELESSGSEDESDEGSDEEDQGDIEVGMGKRRMKIPGRDLDTEDEEEDEDDDDEGDNLDINLSEDEDDAAAARAVIDAAKKASTSKGTEKRKEHAGSFPTEEEIQQADAEAAELEQDDLIEPTKRIAIVNLDWDNMRAIDLYTVFHSVLNSYQPNPRPSRGGADPAAARKKAVVPQGKLLSVRVFPSEFGKERMAREEQEGPAAEVFGSRFVESRNGKSGSRTRARDFSEEASGEDIIDEDDSEALEEQSELEDEGDFSGDEGVEDDDFAALEGEDEGDEEDEDGDDPVGLDMGGDDGDSEASDIPEGDVDMDKLRAYQLERLRYYYAIATFSDVSAAEYIMGECNGTEFERTANVFDMMYVPDDTEFDVDESRDEATEEVKGYKGNDFVTDALRHSKVKLTWDQDDPNRVKVLRRAMTKQEIEEDDFKAYLASSTDEDGSDLEDGNARKTKSTKAKATKPKLGGKALRDLLLHGGDDEADVWGKHGGTGNPFGAMDADDYGGEGGEMEITFKSGLTIKGDPKADADGGDDNETSIERYRRRLKEKMNRKKEKKELKAGTKAAKDAEDVDGKYVARRADEEDEFFNDDGDNAEGEDEFLQAEPEPSFNGKKPTSKPAKLDKYSKKPETAQPTKSGPSTSTLDDLDAVAGVDEAKHFSMQDIIKAEKDAGKKKRKRNKKSKGVEKDVELGDEAFDINVKDDRFKVLHEEPAFAIDPSNPHFVKTKGMSKLLQEGTKRRQQQAAITAAQALQQTQSKQKKTPTGAQPAVGLPQVVAATSAVGSTTASGSGDQSLLDLVANVKRKLGDDNAGGDSSAGKKKRKRR